MEDDDFNFSTHVSPYLDEKPEPEPEPEPEPDPDPEARAKGQNQSQSPSLRQSLSQR